MENKHQHKLSEYRVRDLSVATHLLTLGAKLISVEAQPGFSFFVFENNQLCSELEQSYWSYEKATISSRSLIENYRNLRTQAIGKSGGRNE